MNKQTREHEAQAEQAARVDVLEAMVEAYEETLGRLRAYLESEKFHIDTTVQVSDVLMWLRAVRSNVGDAEVCEPRGWRSAVKPGRWHMEADYERPVHYIKKERRWA